MNDAVQHGRDMRAQILAYIGEHIAEHGWAPTMREIGEEVGLRSPSTVLKHLYVLEHEGKLILGGGPRMIRLTERRIVGIPSSSPAGGLTSASHPS